MSGTYAQFLKNFSQYINTLRKRIVTEMFVVKILYLMELIFLKIVFVVVSFPYFLVFREKTKKTKNLLATTVSPERFQQVLVLSFAVIAVLVIAIQTLSNAFFTQNETFHGAANTVPQFSGSREYAEDIPLAIQSVNVSSIDNSVTFSGTGPLFSHVALFVDNGQSLVATTKVNADGTWTLLQTGDQGVFAAGPHAVFAVFYGDDNQVLGQPSSMKTFEIHSTSLPIIFRYFGFSSFVIAVLTLGFLGLSIVKLKKTAIV